MYKRYVEKRNGENVIPLRNAICGIDMPKWELRTANDNEMFLSGEAVDKLAELEDKIENGTLIDLPCKVGDTVYFISGKIIREEIVKKVEYIITNGKINAYNSYICTYDFNDKDDNFYRLSKLGKSLFLTKAEAEKKLEEIRNGR